MPPTVLSTWVCPRPWGSGSHGPGGARKESYMYDPQPQQRQHPFLHWHPACVCYWVWVASGSKLFPVEG